MIFDKQKISKRAQRLLDQPEFLLKSLDSIDNLDRSFLLILDENDKVLTAHHCFAKESSESSYLFAEAFCILARGKVLIELWKLTFREFENFLRDENHQPAFFEHTEELEREFSKVKLSFLASGHSQKLRDLQLHFKDWSSLSLVLKNKMAQELCQKLGWHLIYAEESVLTIESPFSWASNDELTDFVDEALGGNLKKAAIKVVAVLG